MTSIAKKLNFNFVDAFIDPKVAFSGNQTVVIVLQHDDEIADSSKQGIALEFNLSNIAFVSPQLTNDPSGPSNDSLDNDVWIIRWFTPTCEVSLCGHATLGAAHVLFNTVLPNCNLIRFRTKFNTTLEASRDGHLVVLDFPKISLIEFEAKWVKEIIIGLLGNDGLDKVHQIRLSDFGFLLVRLHDHLPKEYLIQVQPNLERLLQVDTQNSIKYGTILTQKASFELDNAHFRSRYFAPWVGLGEDPVCGSAHTMLTPFWQQVYQAEHGQLVPEFYAHQVSPRSGRLRCQLIEDRVKLKGLARVFASGTLYA